MLKGKHLITYHISHDGTTFVFYLFGVLRILKRNNGNSSEWHQHVVENSEYKCMNTEQGMSLSGDGNCLEIIQVIIPNKTDILSYDCANDKNET